MFNRLCAPCLLDDSHFWSFFQGNIKAQKTTPVKSAISISQSQTESEFEEDQVEAVKSSDNMVFIVEDGRDFEDEQR